MPDSKNASMLVQGGSVPEISVVMPCLNEADTLGTCIEKAQRAAAEAGIDAEIVVADNGSSDASAEIARRLGARVVPVAEPGYGSAMPLRSVSRRHTNRLDMPKERLCFVDVFGMRQQCSNGARQIQDFFEPNLIRQIRTPRL